MSTDAKPAYYLSELAEHMTETGAKIRAIFEGALVDLERRGADRNDRLSMLAHWGAETIALALPLMIESMARVPGFADVPPAAARELAVKIMLGDIHARALAALIVANQAPAN